VTTEPISLLRADLEAARFTVDAMDALWGDAAAAALHRGHRVPAMRALLHVAPADDALATLASLFVLGLPVDAQRAAAALPTFGLEAAAALDLLRVDGDSVVALLDLRPYSFVDSLGVVSWWIASDLGELSIIGPLREDHVLGVGGASTTLSGLMIGAQVESALDLGTGCGIQAMHAARHARRVVATDISSRAIRIAGLNAALNGIPNIEFRLGSLFDPVVDDQFGHIVSNPPFVITPRVAGVPAYEYRDGGLLGDALVASVIAGAADRLQPGGVAQLLGNWEYRGDGDGLERVGEWVDATGLDAWVVEREVQDAALYAETWIRDGGTRPGPEFDRLYGAWLDDFEARGVTRVGFGYLTLRKPLGERTLRRLERLGGPIGSGLGPHLAASVAAHDWQAALTDDALGRAHLTVAGDVTEERHYWPGSQDPTVMTLRQGGGFGRSVPLGTGLAALVGACDGELSVRAITAAIAQLLEVHEPTLLRELLPAVRELVVTGFLAV
jgi:methylase of polypeptide subunit release factors